MTEMQRTIFNKTPELVLVVIMFWVTMSLDINWMHDEKRNKK